MITSKDTRRVIRYVRGKYENPTTRARMAKRVVDSTPDDNPEQVVRLLCYGLGWDAEQVLRYIITNG
jgi:hypothetical protein